MGLFVERQWATNSSSAKVFEKSYHLCPTSIFYTSIERILIEYNTIIITGVADAIAEI